MDKYVLADKIKGSGAVDRELFVRERCRNKRVLDLGCIRHDAETALKDPNWMHKIIKDVAADVVGVDYLQDEIRILKTAGYAVIFGDVTKPLDVSGKFDVIVAGDLIEHLTNFDGFFANCKRLLKPDGILIVSTANPFYSGEFHYLAFKKNFLVNPEHTCWIDPQCLSQLSERFSFHIEDIYYVRKSWRLGTIICETRGRRYDIHKDRWQNDSLVFKIFRVLLSKVFVVFYAPYKFFSGASSALVKHSDYLAVLKPR
jgi:2-polyprenyl-3-methyl-5-hydroxy-6-metoxy-1,4-benzoquinol methylase